MTEHNGQVEQDDVQGADGPVTEQHDVAGYGGPGVILAGLIYDVVKAAATALAEGDPKYSGDRPTIPGGRVGSPKYQ